MPENEYFTPKTVDERIEQLAANFKRSESEQHASVDGYLVETLQRIYRPKTSPEDRHSLERARQRIANARAAAQSRTASGERTEHTRQQNMDRKRSSMMHIRSQFPDAPRKSISYSWLATLAAVLVIALVIGSLLVITSLAHRSQNQAQSSKQTNTAATQQTKAADAQQNVYTADMHSIYKLSGKDGSVIWKQPIKDTIEHNYNLWVSDGTVFLETGLGNSAFYALNAQNGTILWHMSSSQLGQYSMPEILDGTVFMLRRDGTLVAWNGQNGSEKWHDTPVVKGTYYSLNDGSVYLKISNGSLYALDAATGAERWHYNEPIKASATFSSAITFGEGVVYDGGGNALYALSVQNGKPLWQAQASSADQNFVSIMGWGNKIYAETEGALNGHFASPHIYALNAGDGHLLWKLDGFVYTGNLFGVLNLPDDVFLAYRSPNDNTLDYIFNAKDGSVVAKMYDPCAFSQGACGRFPIQIVGQNLYALFSQEGGVPALEQYDLKTGARVGIRQLSVSAVPGHDLFPVNESRGIVYVVPLAGGETINAVRLSDGAVLWKHTLEQAGNNTVRVVVAP